MECPKCQQEQLQKGIKDRWYCLYIWPDTEKVNKNGATKIVKGQPCGFACGLAFFIEDDNANIKTEVGLSIANMSPSQLSIEKITLSPRTRALIQSKALGLNEIDMVDAVEKLEEIKKAEAKEEEWDQYNSMMREVVGRSGPVHRINGAEEGHKKSNKGGYITLRVDASTYD